MYRDLMDKLMMQQDLTREDLFQMIDDVVTETMTDVQIMGFQMAFLMKEPTGEELAHYIRAMQAHCRRIHLTGDILDIAGTGDGPAPGNLAVGTALIAAAAGIPVVKQVRARQKGYYGSTDALSFMGVNLDLTPEQTADLVREVGIACLNAKAYHPALARTLNEQTEAQIRCLTQTVIGPLMNPAYANRFVLGVHDEETLELLKEVAENLEGVQTLLLRGENGEDYLSLDSATHLYHWDGMSWQERTVTAPDLGLRTCSAVLLETASPQENARLITGILDRQITDARRDVLLANAAAALWIGGKADSPETGVALARDLVDTGKAAAVFDRLRSASMAYRH